MVDNSFLRITSLSFKSSPEVEGNRSLGNCAYQRSLSHIALLYCLWLYSGFYTLPEFDLFIFMDI